MEVEFGKDQKWSENAVICENREILLYNKKDKAKDGETFCGVL